MAKKFFRYVPDFDYVSRLSKAQNISDYIRVKNLFKRTKISEVIFNDLTFFTKYQVISDERPDNVAFKIYGDANLDWMILLANNIINVQQEWPLEHTAYYDYLINKYGSDAGIQGIHHYETQEVKNSIGKVIVPKGLELTVKQGDLVKIDQSLNIDPNVGGFGQEETEIVLQKPERIIGYLAFCFSVLLTQVFLILKKKQFEKVQAAELNF